MPNSVLKSVKIPLKLHREVKAESVETDENIEAVIERAWRVYRSAAAQKGYQSLIKKEDAPLPETGDKTLPAKEFENVSVQTVPEGLQSDHLPAGASDLATAVSKLQSSGRIAELHVLTAFATFLVSYEPSEATPEQARAGSTDPIDRAREVIELAQRNHEAASRALEERGIKVPPRADAPRPAKRNRKDGPDERAG